MRSAHLVKACRDNDVNIQGEAEHSEPPLFNDVWAAEGLDADGSGSNLFLNLLDSDAAEAHLARRISATLHHRHLILLGHEINGCWVEWSLFLCSKIRLLKVLKETRSLFNLLFIYCCTGGAVKEDWMRTEDEFQWSK